MEQNFQETCDPVDLTNCSQYYVDTCDCTQFYQCAQNQIRMFHRPCGPGTIYNHKTWVCDLQNNAICQTLRLWERCNETESRMKQLLFMCLNRVPNSNNTWNSDQSTNGISVQMITQTILPLVSITLAMLIVLVIYRYRSKWFMKKDEIPIPIPEDLPYQTLQLNPIFDIDTTSSVKEPDLTPNPLSMPQLNEAERPAPNSNSREDEIVSSGGSSYESIRGSDTTAMPQPSDADEEFANKTVSSEYSANKSVPNLNSQEDEIVSSGGSSYESIRGSDTTAMPQPSEADEEFANKTVSSEYSANKSVPNLNSQEDEIASSGGSSYESIRGSDTTAMSQPSHADEEFANKTVSSEYSANKSVPNLNSQEDEIASSGGSSYESIRGFDTTAMPQPSDADEEFANKTVLSVDIANILVPNLNLQENEIVSSGGDTYESIRGSDTTAMSQPSDADEEFDNKTVSSEDSAYVYVQQPYPLFHPYISGNGPWPHKVIFSTKDHFLPPCTTFETT